ncbi:unnamed protein product [Zymoseptoria tritici ST99CH_1E4]|uniref:Uncharacterized protein n=1 Tax=Zymoseptoria tritici ST99CH_1E4 TaxID=1276532 RepID=A0A2H1H9F6_ZYMTR|nr:unnamed protein product [Zymoseptoria tritici ST99CH_1E4]
MGEGHDEWRRGKRGRFENINHGDEGQGKDGNERRVGQLSEDTPADTGGHEADGSSEGNDGDVGEGCYPQIAGENKQEEANHDRAEEKDGKGVEDEQADVGQEGEEDQVGEKGQEAEESQDQEAEKDQDSENDLRRMMDSEVDEEEGEDAAEAATEDARRVKRVGSIRIGPASRAACAGTQSMGHVTRSPTRTNTRWRAPMNTTHPMRRKQTQHATPRGRQTSR